MRTLHTYVDTYTRTHMHILYRKHTTYKCAHTNSLTCTYVHNHVGVAYALISWVCYHFPDAQLLFPPVALKYAFGFFITLDVLGLLGIFKLVFVYDCYERMDVYVYGRMNMYVCICMYACVHL